MGGGVKGGESVVGVLSCLPCNPNCLGRTVDSLQQNTHTHTREATYTHLQLYFTSACKRRDSPSCMHCDNLNNEIIVGKFISWGAICQCI